MKLTATMHLCVENATFPDNRDESILEIPMGPMGFPWEWESLSYFNGREWDWKRHFRPSLLWDSDADRGSVTFLVTCTIVFLKNFETGLPGPNQFLYRASFLTGQISSVKPWSRRGRRSWTWTCRLRRRLVVCGRWLAHRGNKRPSSVRTASGMDTPPRLIRWRRSDSCRRSVNCHQDLTTAARTPRHRNTTIPQTPDSYYQISQLFCIILRKHIHVTVKVFLVSTYCVAISC